MGCVEIFTIIRPQRRCGFIRGKFLSVEGAEQVARTGSTRGRTGIAIDCEHPLRPGASLDRQLEQVRALPLPLGIARRTKSGLQFPVFQILGVEDLELPFVGEHRDHHPFLLRLVPEHFRITEVGFIKVGDRVPGIFRPGRPRSLL